MLNRAGRLKSVWLFFFNIIITVWLFLYSVIKFDSEALREDSRKVGLGLISAGFLGAVIETDKVTFDESVVLFSVGLLVWIFALIKPKRESKTEATNSDK